MDTYATPTPVEATIDIEAGTVRVVGSDRDTTTVDVRPTDPARAADVEAAAATTVRCADGVLRVSTSRQPFRLLWRPGTVDVSVEVPSGSRLRVSNTAGDVLVHGDLGPCDLRTRAGNVEVDRAGDAVLRTTAGNVTIGTCSGVARLEARQGTIRAGRLVGRAEATSSSGDIVVDTAEGGLRARSSFGEIRVGSALGGEADVSTSHGNVRVGIPEGTVAHVDARATVGGVRNELTPSAARPEGEKVLELSASTGFGTVTIARG